MMSNKRCTTFWLLLLSIQAVCANIIIKTGNYTFDPLDDMPADFGPRISPEGLEGYLIEADPPTACSKMRVPVSPVVAWVALIHRSETQDEQCTFDVKVRNAQEAGAIAAIVSDNVYEPLIIMSKPLGHPDPLIPAVFVSQKTGIVMQKFLTTGTVMVQIIQVNEAVWVSMIMSAMAGVIAVSLMIATFYCIRRQRGFGAIGPDGYQPLDGCSEGMTAEQMRALPIVIAEKRSRRSGSDGSSDYSGSGSDDSPKGPKGGGTLKTCAICLEDYSDGEKLRVLPCNHRFHTECIDQWLSSRKPLCPVCKHDALRPFGAEEAEAQELEQGATEELSADSPRPELSLPPFFFPIRRWRRRWQWGPSFARPGSNASLSAAPVDIEQPAVAEDGASSSNSQDTLHRAMLGSADASSTPVNFPGMHFSRFATTRDSAESTANEDGIRVSESAQPSPDHQQQQEIVAVSSSLSAIRPGRAGSLHALGRHAGRAAFSPSSSQTSSNLHLIAEQDSSL